MARGTRQPNSLIVLLVCNVALWLGGVSCRPRDMRDGEESEAERTSTDPAVMRLREAQQELCDAFRRSGADPRSLPRIRTHIGYLNNYHEPLASAIQQSERIVLGTVETIEFCDGLWARSVFRVEQTLKGKPSHDLTLMQAGKLERSPGGAFRFVELDEAPLLLPGDRAVLFLHHDREEQGYWSRPSSGWYQIVDGTVRMLEGHAVPSTDGMTEEHFIRLIRWMAYR
jgi:hypothetical protein